MVDLKLSLHQYELFHSQAKQRNADIYPPYYKVFEAKKECYPSSDSTTISEMGANIALQSLLNHTVERLVKSCDQNIIEEVAEQELEATYKWGLDGASGQSLYKQVFQGDSENPTVESIMMVPLIPLQIASPFKVIWKNTQPSSTRLCRPIQFDFIKENKATTIETNKLIQDQINALENTVIDKDDKILHIRYKLFSSMFNGKAIVHLTDESTESCNVCLRK